MKITGVETPAAPGPDNGMIDFASASYRRLSNPRTARLEQGFAPLS